MRPNTSPCLKRWFDIVVSSTLLALFSPLMLLIALAIKLDDGGPVFYVDHRAGKDGREFGLCKFRSMVVGADGMGLGRAVAEDDSRITRVGGILRRLTLDELPQFLNVLKGDMSLVGPRPGTPDQASAYDRTERRRLEVRPGMTGWAWIHGRNNPTWQQRIEMDLWYVDHWTFCLDLRILARTPTKVLSGEGLYGNEGTTPDFKGH